MNKARLLVEIGKRLEENGIDLPIEEMEIRRTYAGHWQKSAGAWTWCLEIRSPGASEEARAYSGQIGGYWPARMCCKKGASASNSPGGITLDPPEKSLE